MAGSMLANAMSEAWLTARAVSGLSAVNSDGGRVCRFRGPQHPGLSGRGRPGSVLIYVPVRIFPPPPPSTVTVIA